MSPTPHFFHHCLVDFTVICLRKCRAQSVLVRSSSGWKRRHEWVSQSPFFTDSTFPYRRCLCWDLPVCFLFQCSANLFVFKCYFPSLPLPLSLFLRHVFLSFFETMHSPRRGRTTFPGRFVDRSWTLWTVGRFGPSCLHSRMG